MKLRYFRLSPAWHPLLTALGVWKEMSAGLWSDGDSLVRIAAADEEPSIGFTSDLPSGDCPRLRTPSGLLIARDCSAPSFQRSASGGAQPYVLNHVSIRTPLIEEDHRWFRDLLGANTVLSKSENLSPLDGTVAPEVHLCSGDSYYITLRGSQELRIDHVGWMARRRSLVDEAHALLTGLGWTTVWGPGDLDGSYLVHFRGPDGGVHDIFYPTEELRASAT
jgi:hypothetical protein